MASAPEGCLCGSGSATGAPGTWRTGSGRSWLRIRFWESALQGSSRRTRPISAASRAGGTVVHGRDGDESRAVATGSPAYWWLWNEVVEYGWRGLLLTA